MLGRVSGRRVDEACDTPDETDAEALGTMGVVDGIPGLLCELPVPEADVDADGEAPGTVELVADGEGETPGTLELVADEEGETPGALELEADEDVETPGTLEVDVEALTGVGTPGEALLEVA